MVKAALKNHNKNSISGLINYILTLDKFALKIFNRLSYDRKINRLLAVNFLLDLPDHYSLKVPIKTVNIILFNTKFQLILSSQYFSQSDNIICIDSGKVRLYLMYKHYTHYSHIFEKISIYEYFQFFIIIKQSQQQHMDYNFNNKH